MDVLELVLWGDASDDEALDDAPSEKRRSPIRARDAPPPVLGVETTSPRAAGSKTRHTKPVNPKRVRTALGRCKDEIARLRIAGDYLENILARLREEQRSENRLGDLLAYEARASCEKDRLQQSLAENDRLRELIRTQCELARELEELIVQHCGELHGQSPTRSVPLSLLKAPTEVHPEVLDGLVHTLDAMYLQTDAVFTDARYSSISPTFTDVDVQFHRDTDTLAAELYDSRLVPFDVKSTAKAVWHNILGRSIRPQSGWVENLPNETLRAHFVAFIKVPDLGLEDRVSCLVALRRIVEQTRVIIVRSSIFTHSHPRHGRPMTSRLLGWVAVGKPLHPALHAREGLTQIQQCTAVVPTAIEGGGDADREALTKYLTSVSRHISTESRDEVDRFLLRECGPF